MHRSPAGLATALASLNRPSDRPAREALIIEGLGDRSPAVRDLAIAWAARYVEPVKLIPLVGESADSVLRNAALIALERQGPYAVNSIEQITADPDPDLAMFACQVIGGIGGPTSEVPLLRALARPEVNVVQAAAEALGRLRVQGATPALIALLQGEPWLQLAAADALGSIGDRRAVGPLLALVPESFVAEAALEALTRIGAPAALATLFPLLIDRGRSHLRPALLQAVAASLAEAGPPEQLRAMGKTIEQDHAAHGLWDYLSECLSGGGEVPAPTTAGDAVEGDDRSHERGGGPLVRAAGAVVLSLEVSSLLPLVVRWGATREGAAWVKRLAARVALPTETVSARLATHPDADVRAGCLAVMPPHAIGCHRLLELLADSELAVRVGAIKALGELADGEAARPLAEKLQSEISSERSAAIEALARLPAPVVELVLAPFLAEGVSESLLVTGLAVLASGRLNLMAERVLELAGASNERVRRAAIRAVAHLPGSRAEVTLLRALADRDAGLQAEALDLLVSRGGDRVVTTLIALLGAGDSLRYHVIRALGRLGAERAAAPLETAFPSAPLHEQLEIVGSLAALRTKRSRPFLLQCLQHDQVEIRHAAASALVTLADPEDLELFQSLAANSDWVLRSEAARALGQLGLSEGRSTLVELVRDLEPAVARSARTALAAHR